MDSYIFGAVCLWCSVLGDGERGVRVDGNDLCVKNVWERLCGKILYLWEKFSVGLSYVRDREG